jgi:lysophospholipase L1-like esterase
VKRDVRWLSMLCVCHFAMAEPPAPSGALIAPTDARISIMGRVDASDAARLRFAYPGITIRFRFTGGAAAALWLCDSDSVWITTIVDHGEPVLQLLKKGASEVAVASGLDAGPHTVEIVKRTETWQGVLTFGGVRLEPGGQLLAAPALSSRKLLFIGDSVTCGAGVDNYPTCQKAPGRNGNPYDSYGMLLGRRLDAQVHLVCYGGRGVVRDYRGLKDVLNAPEFFHYSVPTDDAARRAEWSDTRWVPNAVVVSLGTNDWNLQKTQPLAQDEFVTKYVKFLRELTLRYPAAPIFVTQGAIVSDPVLAEWIQETVTRVADDRVRWLASRHYPGSECDAHPELLQHRRMADDLEPVLRQALGW